MEDLCDILPFRMDILMNPELLKNIIFDQKEEKILPSNYFQRVKENDLKKFASNNEIIVLTGIRRSGKSVLLQYIRAQSSQKDYYVNFEDERLATFSVNDFQMLLEILIELFGIQTNFYFDEIQNIPGWEKFVRRLYNAGNKIYLTGSNANLFSEELGTRLTGRYISIKLFPFSYYELTKHYYPDFLNKKTYSTNEQGQLRKLFREYYEFGGIPEYVKQKHTEYLHSLYESIIYRDILARYKITNEKTIKELVFYLASNCSKAITFNSLRKLLGLGSATTVSDYCDYLENSFLCFFVNRYHQSLKQQMIAPKKVYFIDHAFAKTIGFRFSDDAGRILENIVFIELKRRNYDIYYHKNKYECDFILKEGIKITRAIQVCQQLTQENKMREFNGLIEALNYYQLQEGYILTEYEEGTEIINKEEKKYSIKIIPIWKWLLDL